MSWKRSFNHVAGIDKCSELHSRLIDAAEKLNLSVFMRTSTSRAILKDLKGQVIAFFISI
jgi:hypothetical protein